MHTHHELRSTRHGHSITPILVFFGIVLLSVIFFFALTLPRQLDRRRAAATAATPVPPAPETPAPEPPTTPPITQPAPAESAAPAPRFASPRQFMQTVAESLTRGDVAAAAQVLGSKALEGDKAVFFKTVFSDARMRPDPASPVREIGDVGELYRWAIRLRDPEVTTQPGSPPANPTTNPPPTSPPTSPDVPIDPSGPTGAAVSPVPATPAEEVPLPPEAATVGTNDPLLELEVDLARTDQREWAATAVHFPASLRGHIAKRMGAGQVPESIATDDLTDPLKIAGRFIEAVLQQDYALARSVTDTEQVTREKVAGLCILFEEGHYRIAASRPMSATVAGAASAWVIVKVDSTNDGQPSDFGIELQRPDPAAGWRVVGLNFSKLLASYMSTSDVSAGVAYAPIVKSPRGGESLVVYFDFDAAGLVPRARRQLEIVANLLRDDPNRKIRLSGHADAIGAEPYNMRLSSARAFAVKSTLIELGVAAEQIVTEGLGNLQPLDADTLPDGTDNPEGRSRNRRTEIYLDF